MNRVNIIPVPYGKSVLPESMIFRGGEEHKVRPIIFQIHLICAGDRLILADAGCETMPGFEMRDFIGPMEALAQHHVAPEDITDVVITHTHHDHVECVNKFPRSTVYVQEEEYLQGKKYFTENEHLVLFSEEQQICSGVTVRKIGGHSVGSCVIEVADEDKKYVIAGDECYARECIQKQIPTGASYSPKNSEAFLKRYPEGEYQILLSHDI